MMDSGCNVDNPMISHHQFYEWFKTHGRFMQVYFSGFPEDCLSTVPRGEVPKASQDAGIAGHEAEPRGAGGMGDGDQWSSSIISECLD